MRLSINGWHPVASHLVCLITGIALSNLLNLPVQTTGPTRGELTFSVSEKMVVTDLKFPPDGARTNIFSRQGTDPECRMFKTALIARQQDNQLVFATTLRDQFGLHHLTKELKLNKKVGVQKDNPKVPLCRTKPRISYGS